MRDRQRDGLIQGDEGRALRFGGRHQQQQAQSYQDLDPSVCWMHKAQLGIHVLAKRVKYRRAAEGDPGIVNMRDAPVIAHFPATYSSFWRSVRYAISNTF